jgi:tetratricopeptide (TPR) repeat protein
MNSIEKYILTLKEELNHKIFSPYFIKLANMYFLNGQYEECVLVCNTGLQIFPNYLTAKLLLLKALLKLEHLSEAEKVFNEISYKISNPDLLMDFKHSIEQLRNKPTQEKLFYVPKPTSNTIDYETYSDKFISISEEIEKINIDTFIRQVDSIDSFLTEEELKKLKLKYDELNIDATTNATKIPKKTNNNNQGALLSKFKKVTLTLADLLMKQGYLKDAFEAYTLLLNSNTENKIKIQEKLNELERNLFL